MGPDAEYLEFLAQLEAPVEKLPSAEVQMEKREAEKAAAAAVAAAAGEWSDVRNCERYEWVWEGCQG